jgi:transketolase
MALNSLSGKWQAFGWNALEIDGHDYVQIIAALESFKLENAKPTAIIAHTVKGKGVSFMQDENNWHYRIPTADEVKLAKLELGVTS